MTIKYIARIGLFDDTALVIVGYKMNKDDPYPEFRGFTFRLGSHTKSLIKGTRELSDWLPMWEFRRVAHFEDNRLPDIVFRYLSCTECEATEFLASFRYDRRSRDWTLRHWSKEDGDDLLIGSDDQSTDEGAVSYECLHTVRDLTGDGLDDVAIRCRETQKVTTDETVLYTMRKGVFGRTVVRGPDPMNASIQEALCESMAKSPLCEKR